MTVWAGETDVSCHVSLAHKVARIVVVASVGILTAGHALAFVDVPTRTGALTEQRAQIAASATVQKNLRAQQNTLKAQKKSWHFGVASGEEPNSRSRAARPQVNARKTSVSLRYPTDLATIYRTCNAALSGSTRARIQLGWYDMLSAHGESHSSIPAKCLARIAAKTARLAKLSAIETRRHLRTPRVHNPVRLSKVKKAPTSRRKLARTVSKMAREFRLDPRLVMAIIQIESGFRPKVRSSKKAAGYMQLMPATAKRFGIKNTSHPIQNLRGGMAYLRWLLAYYRGDISLALAAYNAGEGNVDKYKGVPPFPETMVYVQKIRAIYHRDHHPYNLRVSTASSPAVQIIQRHGEGDTLALRR